MNKTIESTQNVRVGTVKNRAHTEWVNIEEVIPNTLNPRQDDSIKSAELQAIIKSKGWEMPLTCYKKGGIYVLLSGHRRLYAARQAKIKQIPIFIVDAPKTLQEEVERIASAQLAQEDWSAIEWARFTYERWIAWQKPGMKTFAQKIQKPLRTVESYVRVLDYFPMQEIEAGLNQKTYSLSLLLDVYFWIKKVKEVHPTLTDELTEDMIRRVMVEKTANRKTSRESLRKKDFINKVSASDLKTFLFDKAMHLEDVMAKYEFDIKEKTFHSQLVSMGFARRSVKNISPKNAEEAKKAADILLDLKNSLEQQIQYIDRKYPNAIAKEDLFTWKKVK